MPYLRFRNPELQARFLADLQERGFGSPAQSDGSVRCDDVQWPEVNSVAHRIRDSLYRWYFTWCDSPEMQKEFEIHLRSNDLRYELEDHGDRLVFLLPKEDEPKHAFGDAAPAIESCSFCGKVWTDIEQFFTSDSAAICNECVTKLYGELSDASPNVQA